MRNLPANTSRALSATFARGVPKYFTKDEVEQIIYHFPDVPTKVDADAINIERQRHFNQKFVCWFLWQTGARIQEAFGMRVEDMEPYAGVIHIQTAKKRTGHIRTIPKHPEFFNVVGSYLAVNEIKNRSDKLFSQSYSTLRRWAREACKRAGFEGDKRSHPHTFRHSFAVNCLIQQVPITVLQEWLGHADVTKTLIYTKVLAKDTTEFMRKVEF